MVHGKKKFSRTFLLYNSRSATLVFRKNKLFLNRRGVKVLQKKNILNCSKQRGFKPRLELFFDRLYPYLAFYEFGC